MISILLPIYNYNCSKLIQELHRQAVNIGIPFEIIAMEDGSEKYIQYNRAITEKLNCRYILLPHNIGRSAIRNLLASEARYEWLLYMDCDSRLPNEDFILRYLEEAGKEKWDVICGGRIFEERSKITKDYLLHWYCGTQREPQADRDNQERPFLSNNFLIRKRIFNSVKFEEELKGYGHEDTLFGIALKREGIEIHYMNNPVLHEGLDSNEAFLIKSRVAVANLRTLKEQFLHPDDYRQIKLLFVYEKLHNYRLTPLIRWGYKLTSAFIEKQLKSEKPILYLFDFYKIGLLCKVMIADRPPLRKTDH
ncbi:MAG: glycosyltransferase [Bacteroidales bacterium]